MARSRRRSRPTPRNDQTIKLLIDCAVAVGFMLLATLLGGASAGGFAENGLIQAVSTLIIAAALYRFDPRTLVPAERTLWLLAVAFLIVILLQLVPLPPSLWTALPGR